MFAKSIFSFKSMALRPRLACEITPAGVVAARPGASGGEILPAFAHLPPGSFTAQIKTPLFRDRGAVVKALREAVGEVGLRETKLTVIVPDASVRVLLLDFDGLPGKAADIPPIVRFRLRKLLPFPVEDAAVSFQTMPAKDGVIRLLVAVSPASVVSEYESAVREAGYDPGAILPSTLAALAAVEGDEPSLVVNRNSNSVTTAIARQNELLLHRTLEFGEFGEFAEFGEFGDQELAHPRPAQKEERRSEALQELRQAVSVAIAYFEDTLSRPPLQLLSCGLGGADDLMRLLGEQSIPARDLAPSDHNAASMPRGVLAGVLGALAS